MRRGRRSGSGLACAAGLLGVLWLGSARGVELPAFEQVRAAHPVSDFTLLDRRGEPLQTLRLNLRQRVQPWVALEQVSPALLHALLLSEDQRFYEHSGVDWSAVAASAWGNLWNRRTRGASTVTMQLAGLLDEELAQRGGRSLAQKLGQAWVAGRLEQRWSKAQILEAYLNRVPLRGELVGVPAAAQALFGKRAAGLDGREAALLAAMLRAPNAEPAVLASRACGLLQAMRREPVAAGCPGLSDEVAAVLRRRPLALGDAPQWAPHYARLALRADGPARQRSSLDGAWQRLAVQSLRRHLAELSGRQVEDGAVLVLDNASGAVLAWVGSSGAQLSEAAQLDHVLARRQAGSTLKPFLYELALERRLITAASLLDDSPAQITTVAGVYLPQNYDKQYRGWVSARAALGSSLNIPAVRLSLMLGPEALFERLNALGLQLPETGGLLRPLPGAGQRRRQSAGADQCLPQPGQWRPLHRRGAARRRPGARPAGGGCPGGVHSWRHAGRQQRPRAGLWAGQRALAAISCCGQDRHQQGHARQLVHWLQRPLHRGRVGGQCQWPAHASGLRCQRGRPHLARADAGSARRPARL